MRGSLVLLELLESTAESSFCSATKTRPSLKDLNYRLSFCRSQMKTLLSLTFYQRLAVVVAEGPSLSMLTFALGASCRRWNVDGSILPEGGSGGN